MYSFPLYCTDPAFDPRQDISHDKCPYGNCNRRDMARSTYIYVVVNRDREVEAAFTVKHEMVAWTARNPQRSNMVFRIKDGRGDVAPMAVGEWRKA